MIHVSITDRQALLSLSWTAAHEALRRRDFEEHPTEDGALVRWRYGRMVQDPRGMTRCWLTTPALDQTELYDDGDRLMMMRNLIILLAAIDETSELDVYVELGGDLGLGS